MGTPMFSVPALTALVEAGHDVVGVYTRPDRRAGRGKRLAAPHVKQAALKLGLAVSQPASLRRDERARREIEGLSPDVIVVAAYGLFLPADMLALPRLGCLNIHPSLLPKYRGPSPVVSAILNGDDVSGVSVMKLDQGMDSGPLLATRETLIGPRETAEGLTARLFEMGAALLVEVLPSWKRGEIDAQSQDESLASVTRLVSKEDGRIAWDEPAARIARQTRAYHPWPGAYTSWHGAALKIIEASAAESAPAPVAAPGETLLLADGRIGIGTGGGVLEVTRLKIEGRAAVSAREFVRGRQDFVGARLGE